MARAVQGEAMAVIIMALWFILTTISVQPSCSRLRLAAGVGGKWVSVHRGKLPACTLPSCLRSCYAKGLDCRIVSTISIKLSISPKDRFVLPSSFSQARCVHLKWFPALSYCPADIALGLIVPPLPHLIMVRQSMRSGFGARHGSRRRSKASCFVDPALHPVNIPSSPVDSPPLSLARRPIPNSVFQTTHFKFQSNLNRPMITAL